jgi:hypothetical protein
MSEIQIKNIYFPKNGRNIATCPQTLIVDKYPAPKLSNLQETLLMNTF